MNPPPLRPRLAAAVALACLAALATGAQAQAPAVPDARVVELLGEVTLDGSAVAPGATLRPGTLATGAGARVQVRLPDGAMLELPPDSRVRLAPAVERRLGLLAGGLRLASTAPGWQVDLPGRALRATGMLHLVQCAAGCTAAPGLYGSTAAGEAVLEYVGGRSVLRNRHFRWADAALRPEVLVAQPAVLVQANLQKIGTEAALRVRTEAGATLKAAIEAFRDGDDARADTLLQQVRDAVPGETLVAYYLGLIALKRQDNATALAQLQLYAREDPDGAVERDVTKTLTLLSSAQLQQEVATALAQEKSIASGPPEPGSIAVQAFVNRGDAQYRAMAKGLAAMVIADLAKVPGLNVLEREKVQLMRDEMKLGESGLADPASAVRSGRLMRAEKVIIGNFEVQ